MIVHTKMRRWFLKKFTCEKNCCGLISCSVFGARHKKNVLLSKTSLASRITPHLAPPDFSTPQNAPYVDGHTGYFGVWQKCLWLILCTYSFSACCAILAYGQRPRDCCPYLFEMEIIMRSCHGTMHYAPLIKCGEVRESKVLMSQ